MATDPQGLAIAQAKKTIRLTSRWEPLKHNDYQAAYVWHPAPIKVCPAGRRSGKTELGKRKLVVRELLRRRKWPARLLAGAPTHEQAEGIFWEDLLALIPPWWIARTNKTRLTITTTWGAMVKVAGLDRPRRVEGVPWDWMLLDEMADMPKDCFNLNLMPALSTVGRKVAADLIGVPDEVGRNQAEYENLFDLGLRWQPGIPPGDEQGKAAWDPDVCSFHWGSEQVLEPEKLAALKSRMSKQQYDQEYGGLFLRSGGKALPDFDYHTGGAHVDDKIRYLPGLPIDWAMDFGTSPMATLICQYRPGAGGGDMYVHDEIVLSPGDTPSSCREFVDRCGARGFWLKLIRIFGDAAGRHPSSSVGVSDYEMVERYLAAYDVEFLNLDVNPLIKDTLNALRMATMDAIGRVRLHIHPRCENLIKDLKDAPWPDPKKLKEFHCMAALRYYAWAHYQGYDAYAVTPMVSGNLGQSGSFPKTGNR